MKRRTALVMALGVAAGSMAGACTRSAEPPPGLRIAAGEPGGFYVEFARLLARTLDATVGYTNGSHQNIAQVHVGRATLGLSLADVAEAAVAGREPFGEPLPLRAIGRVYENYMQLVVSADSAISSVGDLAGRRISLGAAGSGAAIFGERLLAAARVNARVDHNELSVATKRLARGEIDALLWSGGVPTPALTALSGSHAVRLLDLTTVLPALLEAYDAPYHRVVIPAGTYGNTGPVATIGVPNLLLASRTLSADTAAAVARTLVQQAPRLVPASALGTQYLELRSLIATGSVPLHPGAADAYRELRG
ncbi:MAG: TAXI family TRAP transporter solute-binding subunit [Thermocrispum agreste]|uniref:C4-dicarboxylate ABC transporter substrate-binding protein n=1 Tax=Thermocrispum agreste TaxID=37925 RepID=A0A2W4J8U3_9PSEU|nr:MAG: C4-dicarboxylate ABC transporter substrate-binding protein [Thermocrispum agreste]